MNMTIFNVGLLTFFLYGTILFVKIISMYLHKKVIDTNEYFSKIREMIGNFIGTMLVFVIFLS